MFQVSDVSLQAKLTSARWSDVNDAASTAVGDSDAENLSPSSTSTQAPDEEKTGDGQVIIKSTFLDVEECPSLIKRFRTLRRSKTDSDLFCRCPDDDEEAYQPGRFSDERTGKSAQTSLPKATAADENDQSARSKARRPTICLESALRCESQGVGTQAPHADKTTVMLRNLPNNYTREMFLAMLDDRGFRGRFDFAYLPCDFHRRANLGYAFVNFVNAEAAVAAWRCFDGFSDWALPSQKVCAVSWSGPHQGLEQHVERYRNSPVMHKSVPDEYRPVVFENGVRQRFPSPTRSLKKPDQTHRNR